MCDPCFPLLLTAARQFLGVKGELSWYIAKILAQPPRCTSWILGILRSQANVLGILEQVGAPDMQVVLYYGRVFVP